MTENMCNKIQEDIAWQRSLTETEKLHVLGCQDCLKVQAQMEDIDSQMNNLLEIDVPENFSNQIMMKIKLSQRSHTSLIAKLKEFSSHTFAYWTAMGSIAALINFFLPMAAH